MKKLITRFLLAVALSCVGMIVLQADEDCTGGATSHDDSTPNPGKGYGTARGWHGSMMSWQCPLNMRSRVEAWIDGFSFQGCGGAFNDTTLHSCVDEEDQSSIWAVSRPEYHGCGGFTSKSNHWLRIVDGAWYSIQQGRSQDIYADGCHAWYETPEACYEEGGEWQYTECILPNSPLIISLDQSNQYKLTSAADGVAFDINVTGTPIRISWTRANDEVAFIAWDRDGNGTIDSGAELFGSHTYSGVGNGFAALAKFVAEHGGNERQGSVSADDGQAFALLQLWTDRNHNGFSEPSELQPLAGSVADVMLGYNEIGKRDQWGNRYRYQGVAHIRTGQGRNGTASPNDDLVRRRKIYDVFFVAQ